MLYGATNSKNFSDKLDVYELISEKVKLTKMNHITNKSPVSQFKMTRKVGMFKREHPYSRPQTSVRRCFACGETDHQIKDCVKHKEKGPKCFNCEMYGHYAKDCLRGGSSSRADSNLKQESFNNRETNTVTNTNWKNKKNRKNVWLENTCVSAVVDTGSDINSEYERIGSPKLEADSTNFKGVGNLLSNWTV